MKFLLALLLTGKLGKVLITGGTMLLSVLAYSLTFGWRYAVGLVALIFVHEMGHFIAARNSGLPVGVPVFIPFVGAWVSLKTTELSPQTEAHVALAGPVLGTAGAFVCYLVAQTNGERLWLAIAYGGFFLNLFNLIPLRPLDGGRVVRVVSTRLWLVGLPLLAAAFFWHPSPMLVVIAVLALPDAWASLKKDSTAEAHRFVSRAVKLKYGALYLGLLTGLAAMTFQVHGQLTGGA